MNPENELILLEIGTRLRNIEQTISDLCLQMQVLIPVVATLQEQTLYRVKEMNRKNGH